MITLAENNRCTGCGACAEACFKNAIKMTEDKEGFLFPVIDEKLCTECKKCLSTCPVINIPQKAVPSGVFGARAKDEDSVLKSSSGGVFSVLANKAISLGGIVYGAGYNEKLDVVHKSAEKAEDIEALMGSKYVQSDMNDTYRSVENNLKAGRKVLFAGTPCQCAGLSRFLSKEYSNLLMVDFVCHGVPSRGLYRKYLEYMGTKGEIKSVRFRDKTTDRKSGHCISIEYKDGNIYREASVNDPYMLGFLQNINLRKSCYNCSFKDFATASDITIGDFWGIDKTDSFLSDKEGVSLVILNTDKGKTFFEGVGDMVLADKRTAKEALAENKSLITSTGKNPLRDKYLRDMHKLNVKKLCDKYCSNSTAAKIRRLIAKCRKDR